VERFGVAVLLAMLVGAPIATAASQRVSIMPIAGVYVPLKIQSNGGAIGDICDPGPCPETEWDRKLAPGPAFGIKVAVDWDASFGVEASFAYAATARGYEVTFDGPSDPPASGTAETTVAAVRATMTRPVFGRAAIRLGAGFARNTLSGSGYDSDPIEDQSRMGLTLAGALRLNVGSSVQFEVGLASSFYSVEEAGEPASATNSFPQHDMIISIGVAMGLGK